MILCSLRSSFIALLLVPNILTTLFKIILNLFLHRIITLNLKLIKRLEINDLDTRIKINVLNKLTISSELKTKSYIEFT